MTRFDRRIRRGLWALSSAFAMTACGAASETPAAMGADGGSGGHDCASGTVSCSTCNGGFVCASSCPDVACPTDAEAGASEAGAEAAASVVDGAAVNDASRGSACPLDKPSSCADCSGGVFCVSGLCPIATCPSADAAVDAPAPTDAAVRSDSNTMIPDGGPGPLCPGAPAPAAGYTLCRTTADCIHFGYCSEGPYSGCGPVGPLLVKHDCQTDSDCLATASPICESYVDTNPCASGGPNGTRCVPKCVDTATSCDPGMQCLASGHCQPTPCGQGYPCPMYQVCTPAAATADVHSCSPQLCTGGFTCAADQECSATSMLADVHGCAPKSCSNGYSCPAWWSCLAGAGADPHGCTAIPCSTSAPCGMNESCDPTLPGRGCTTRKCTSDTDCDCGACVLGYCRSSLWICITAPP